MRQFLLVTASLAALSLAPAAFATPAEDAAYNKDDKPIMSSFGNCVRTKWDGDKDVCAPAAEPAPAPKPYVAAPRVPAPVPNISQEQRSVYFDFNSAKLTGEGRSKLDQLANIINKSSEISEVRIHGYTDQIGSASYNDALAEKRAKAVRDYLDSKTSTKVSQGDIRGLGKAESDAACDGKARKAKIACMATQRRVEVEFKAKE
jgi:OOP family OmpA-OmpF porin